VLQAEWHVNIDPVLQTASLVNGGVETVLQVEHALLAVGLELVEQVDVGLATLQLDVPLRDGVHVSLDLDGHLLGVLALDLTLQHLVGQHVDDVSDAVELVLDPLLLLEALHLLLL